MVAAAVPHLVQSPSKDEVGTAPTRAALPA
jgi:hypothetical protein